MAETLYFGTDELRMSAGKFRTTRRYIRAATTAPLFAVAQTRTMDIVYSASAGLGAWRYSVNGYVQYYAHSSGSSSYAATVREVKI